MATGIYKRSNVWWIRYTGIDGRQKRESSHSKEHKAAVSLLADRLKTISVGKEPEIKRIPNYTLRELAEKYVIKGINDFHFHDLRHTFASHLVMAGVDITTVSRLLGHKSLTMTLRYSHLAPAHMQKAVNIPDNALNEKTISTKLAQFNG